MRSRVNALVIEEFRESMEVITDVICMLKSMKLARTPLNALLKSTALYSNYWLTLI